MIDAAHARVLVVEDEFMLALHAEQTLHELGFTDVVRVSTVAEGRHEANLHPPDLAVLDINIGAELVYGLAADLLRRGVPLIFVTSVAPQDIPQALANHPVLAKPLETAALASAIKSVGLASNTQHQT